MCPIFVKVIDPLHLQNAVIHLLAFHSLKYNSLKPCQVLIQNKLKNVSNDVKPAFIDSRAASCNRLVESSDGSESISVSISLIFRVIIVLNKTFIQLPHLRFEHN